MNLSELYLGLLRDVGLSATYCGLYDYAEQMYMFGIKECYDDRKSIEALVQNELMRERYDFALSELEKWEVKHGQRMTSELILWKAALLHFVGRKYDAECIIRELNRVGNRADADEIEGVLQYIDVCDESNK